MTVQGALRRLWVPAYFCLLAVIVFATQFAGTGFGLVKGKHYAGASSQHYAWVSSHNLAIASRATPENGFVGHARSFLDADGAPDYLYFDRYPPFFSVTLGALTSLTEDLATKVWIARQLMHVIFILTMLFAWLLLRRLGLAPGLALVVVTLSFSGHILLFYRELIHFDHAALLGMMILLYVIARVKLEERERWRWLTVATLVAVNVGSNLLSMGVLALWAIMEALALLWQRERTLEQCLRDILRHDATRMLLLGVVWSAMATGYNVAHEMARREVPPAETSIIESLQRRLPGGEVLSDWQPDYDAFFSRVESRLLRWFFPLDEQVDSFLFRRVSLPLLLLVVYFHLRSEPAARRIVLFLTAFSGLITLFVMINLAWFHGFTTSYALGFALVFWLALLGRVRKGILKNFLLALAPALFLYSALDVEAKNRSWHEPAAVYTDDYNRILQKIGYRGSVLYSDPKRQDQQVTRPKYLLSFYLGDNYLATNIDDADYMVANRDHLALPAEGRAGMRLLYTQTPENRVGFLFDLIRDERPLPQGIAPRYNFGGELALGHWELLDSVQVQPCQRMRVESWWQAPVPLSVNYYLQLSLTNEDGGILNSADSAPVSGDTKVWEAGAWYPDVRDLEIPCDAKPGAFPLIFSVYDPESSEESDKLALLDADGSDGDTWLYLTTVFVN